MQYRLYIKLIFLALMVMQTSCKNKEKQPVVKQHKTSKSPAKNKENSKENTENASTLIQQKLGISGKEVRENKLYSFIGDWYSVPYKYGGCTKSGVDCSCFTSILCENVYNKKIARSTGEMYQECEKIGLEDAKEGDLVFFKINGNTISHVGIYLKKKSFVHSSTSKGVIINNLDEVYYKKYFFCAGRIKKS